MNIIFSNKAKLPTKYGTFNIISFKQKNDHQEHCLIYMGNLKGKENILTRIHSECLTGDVFTSQKCDCGDQLEKSMQAISDKKEGIILYLRQEGRGIGLFNKINAYALQDEGQDTIQANHSLGFGTDLRDFSIAAEAINYMGIKSIELLSNNPDKIKIWNDSGIAVSKRIPLIVESNTYNSSYLNVSVKRRILYLVIIGVLLFSGSIYGLSTNTLTSFDFTSIAFITPIGGLLLILSWIVMLIGFIKIKAE